MELLFPFQHKLRVEQYHRMVAAGVLGANDRVELLDGVLVDMSPQSPPHAGAIVVLQRILHNSIGAEYQIRTQLPLTIPPDSEPEPDIAVCRTAADPRHEHPTEALLVIESARDSLAKDRIIKGRLYARAGVPEYWILDLDRRCVEVYRDPDPHTQTYRTLDTVSAGELRCQSLPAVVVSIDEIFA